MTFQFAWAGPAETSFGPEHAREDEEVFAFWLEHTEGDFPTLSLDIRNPRRQFLGDGADLWMWLAEDGVPLFFGRLVALPEDLHAEIVRLTFVARPSGYDATKRALAETLKTAPFWDPVWIRDERISDPDTVLEARTALWHIDRVTHEVTVSDIIAGEDGTLAISDHDYDSLSLRFAAPPVRRVKVDAEISWDQQASGTLDITAELLAAFESAGSPKGVVSSYTGQGLEADWPAEGDDLKGGWRVGAVTLERADGVWRIPRHRDARVGSSGARVTTAGSAAEAFVSAPVTARFFAWEFRPSFPLAYDVSRQRIERVSFELVGDVQRVFTDAGEDEQIIIALGSRKVSEAIDGVVPIGDVRRASYLKTDRGRQSLEYLIALARARLLARARAAEVRVTIPFADGAGLSCRMNATITDSRLPGGSATGKVIAYTLRAGGGDGERIAEVTIGCTIGNGTTRSAEPGTPAYVDDGYVKAGWQLRAGETIAPIAGEVTYPDLTEAPIEDDGIDFLRLEPADVIESFTVLNGEAVQAAVLDGRFADIPAAIEALNAAHTEAVLDLMPLTGGPFETEFAIAVSDLAVPRTLAL